MRVTGREYVPRGGSIRAPGWETQLRTRHAGQWILAVLQVGGEALAQGHVLGVERTQEPVAKVRRCVYDVHYGRSPCLTSTARTFHEARVTPSRSRRNRRRFNVSARCSSRNARSCRFRSRAKQFGSVADRWDVIWISFSPRVAGRIPAATDFGSSMHVTGTEKPRR